MWVFVIPSLTDYKLFTAVNRGHVGGPVRFLGSAVGSAACGAHRSDAGDGSRDRERRLLRERTPFLDHFIEVRPELLHAQQSTRSCSYIYGFREVADMSCK